MNRGMAKSHHTLRTTPRYFYASNNINFIEECTASKSTVKTWFKEFKSFDTIKPGKTYVQALLSDLNNNCKKSKKQNVAKVNDNPKICSLMVHKKHHTVKNTHSKVPTPHVQTEHPNNVTVTKSSVAGDRTIDQIQQDPLVLSNKFQMLATLVDKQEQDQQTPHVSFGSVSLPIGTKNAKKN